MIARVLGLAACALTVISFANAQDKKPPEEKKLTPVQQAVEDARKQLLKERASAKTPEEALRAELSIAALDRVPTKISVLKLDGPVSFDEGFLRYTLEEVRFRGDTVFVQHLVTNSSDQAVLISEPSARLRSYSLSAKEGTPAKAEALHLISGNRSIESNKQARIVRTFTLKTDPLPELHIDFPGDNAKGLALTRMIVPAEKLVRVK